MGGVLHQHLAPNDHKSFLRFLHCTAASLAVVKALIWEPVKIPWYRNIHPRSSDEEA